MESIQFVKNFWHDMDAQNWESLFQYFKPDALINWPNTKEQLTVREFVRVNEQYPGRWNITVKSMEHMNDRLISVVHVELAGGNTAFTAVSFFDFQNELISGLTEYWGDIAEPPEWRKEKLF
nr:nuclear transport factor 2 family protein [uncultured Caproiciproducens sp.]